MSAVGQQRLLDDVRVMSAYQRPHPWHSRAGWRSRPQHHKPTRRHWLSRSEVPDRRDVGDLPKREQLVNNFVRTLFFVQLFLVLRAELGFIEINYNLFD